jgi:glutamine cyclotransferase
MKSLIPVMLPVLFLLTGCFNPEPASNPGKRDSSRPAEPALLTYSVVATLPHDTTYFTEGLEYYDGKLWESSGGNLAESPYPSVMGLVNTNIGKNDPHLVLDRRKYFAEGITFFNNKLYWLTLDNGIGFVYDATDFKQLKSFKLPSIEKKGWGLTHNSQHLIMSDGTDRLYFLHPDSLNLVKYIKVQDHHGPVNNLNELEFINGYIYANQWLTSWILIIDPATGFVKAKIDLEKLQEEADKKLTEKRELNGIAYNSTTGNIMITGKKWPMMYEISVSGLPTVQ